MLTDKPPPTRAVGMLLGAALLLLPFTAVQAATRTDLQAARISLEAARDALSAATAEFRAQQTRGAPSRCSFCRSKYIGR